MLKVLFVDDEPRIIEGLKVMTDWAAHGFRICGQASNGEDAMEIMRHSDPDLVITDIRMPGMDGLELIKQSVEKLRSNAKFIILSGYNEFNYVQKAMLYNVCSYLLKPLDDIELEELVSKLSAEIRLERKKACDTDRRLAFLANQTIRRIIKGDARETVTARAGMLLEIERETPVSCVLFDVGEDSGADREAARRVIEAELGPDHRLHFFEDDRDRFGIIVHGRMPSFGSLESFASRLSGKIGNAGGNFTAAAVSAFLRGPESIAEAYRQCVFALNYRFFLGNGGVISYLDVKDIALKEGFRMDSGDDLLEAVRTNDRDRILRCGRLLFERYHKDMTAPEFIQIYIRNIELELIKIVAGLGGDAEGMSHAVIEFNKASGRLHMNGLQQAFLELCLRLADLAESLKQSNPRDLADEIRKYIEHNYARDIKLKTVAKEFHMNPVYLGQLYKKSTGMQFNEYLTMVRIQEAKRLLKKTDMKIAEIARAVGYNDTEYFTGRFKAFTHQLPSGYKA